MGENHGAGLVVGALFVVLLAVGVVQGIFGAEVDPAGPAVAERTTTAPSGRARATSTTVAVVASTPAPRTGASDEAAPEGQAGADQALPRPVGPALPEVLAQEVKAVATAVLRADVSGEGREQFGDYWGEDLYRPCCRDVVVHSAVARPVEGREATVVVSMEWSAERLDAGPPRDEVETDVYLVERAGSWVPVRPAEGGG
jgi:hypothetical protein